VPTLRIVTEGLWQAVRARHQENRRTSHGSSPRASVRPKHLLSGKLTCGVCGGSLIRSGSEQRFMCSRRREQGQAVCSNGRSIKGAEVEQRVLAAIKDRLLAPERVALAVEEARLAAAQESLAMGLARSKAEAELAEVKRR